MIVIHILIIFSYHLRNSASIFVFRYHNVFDNRQIEFISPWTKVGLKIVLLNL